MIDDFANNFKKLSEDDFRILLGIENGMRYHEWVPLEEIQKYTRLTREKLQFKLFSLVKRKLVQRNTLPYEGFRIYFEAYDFLALNTFVKRNTVNAIGKIIGVGKESIVHEAQGGLLQREIAIKFHREGRTSFKHVRRQRSYLGERKHISWIYASRLGSQKEYEALTTLHPGVSVPEPLDHNRHAIVMEMRKEPMLVHQHLEHPEQCLDKIIQQLSTTYELGLIHGDLSEFNILAQDNKIVIIDWPQSIKTTEPNATELLRRDIFNLLTFFKRKYNINKDPEETLNQIMKK